MAGWPGYLADFHRRRAGITEQVLTHARDVDGDAYQWLAGGLPGGRMLDLACGNGALWPHLTVGDYLGVDTSPAELAAAQARGVRHLVRASAAALPLPDDSVDVVACSMALQVLTPMPQVLAEIARVLRPGGHLVATVPAAGPLRPRDLAGVLGLLAALGRPLRYPNDAALRHLPEQLADAGLRLIADERRRFPYRLSTTRDADLFLASLYLPGLAGSRYRAACRWLHVLARLRLTLPLPVRRIHAVRVGSG